MDGVRKSIVVGQYNTQPDDASGLPGIVIGVGLAEQLQVFLGDTVTLLSPAMIEVAMTSMASPTGRAAVIRGMFQSNAMRDIDYGTVITSDVLVQNLSRRKGIDAIDVLVEHPRDVAAIAASLRSNVGATLRVDTWQDLNRGLYDTMKLERLGSFIVLALIVVVAAFNILVTLTLGVSEKRRDIAVLKTMGATDSVVARVFRVQGLVIGLISVMLGTLCGLGLVLGQQTFQWVTFDTAAGYLVPALPVELHLSDVLATAATGMLLSSIAAIYPARRAARAVVADGVRAE
jgi:lipoprotein-releasing system permease protein